jgi:hypothetical protein
MLDGGSCGDAMVELTAGVSEKFNLSIPKIKQQIDSGDFFKMIDQYIKSDFLIGCTKILVGQKDKFGPRGILFNHSYSVI